MLRILPAAFALFLATSMGHVASAQSFHEACAYDINFYCQDVEPGDGRIASCLYAHSDTLTDACHAATDDIGRIMEGFFDRLQALHAACAPDVEKHCSGETLGNGQLLMCLKSQSDISKSCSDGIANINYTPAQ